MSIQSKSKAITLHDVRADRTFILKVHIEDGLAGMCNNVSLKQFGASSRGALGPSMAQSGDDADIEAEWLATGDTVGSPAIQCQDVASQNSFPSGSSEPLSQQLHAKVGFGAGMTAHVHGVCVNDRVRVTVESSEAWARSIKLHAQATLMDKSGDVIDTHRTIIESSIPSRRPMACFSSLPCMAGGHCMQAAVAAAATFLLLALAIAKGVTWGIESSKH